MKGQGKYDDLLTVARVTAGATAAALVIANGRVGPGFSVQCPPHQMLMLAQVFRDVAAQIENDFASLDEKEPTKEAEQND